MHYHDPITGKRRRKLEKKAGYEIFKCVYPGCTSYVPKELAAGRTSLCWRCGDELTLTDENLRYKRPTHEYCRKIRVKKIGAA